MVLKSSCPLGLVSTWSGKLDFNAVRRNVKQTKRLGANDGVHQCRFAEPIRLVKTLWTAERDKVPPSRPTWRPFSLAEMRAADIKKHFR